MSAKIFRDSFTGIAKDSLDFAISIAPLISRIHYFELYSDRVPSERTLYDAVSSRRASVSYPLVLTDEEGNELWCSNVRGGEDGEESHTAKQILNYFGVPISRDDLVNGIPYKKGTMNNSDIQLHVFENLLSFEKYSPILGVKLTFSSADKRWKTLKFLKILGTIKALLDYPKQSKVVYDDVIAILDRHYFDSLVNSSGCHEAFHDLAFIPNSSLALFEDQIEGLIGLIAHAQSAGYESIPTYSLGE